MYDHIAIENKWQKIWEESALFQQTQGGTLDREKMYLLFAFAYPSGAGLHVGHVESKTALDILARFYRMNGKDVFFPVGWDAFGLPAENYAIKTGVHPNITTKEAIHTFRRQIKRIGISYDWANELATNHPEYYKWTQWIFLQLFNKGLAYQKNGMVNWCPSCQTVLANEQVVDGYCERCDSEVIQKEMKQWYYKITKYQNQLIDGLQEVDWPEATKAQQLNWIGKKSGVEITYQIANTDRTITCFTTRPDTNFGATFIVIAPEHELAQAVASGVIIPENNPQTIQENVQAYIEQTSKKTELDRQQEGKKKTGVFTGFSAINQLTGKKMPIWVSDFVLGGFGTGAVVGVPAHDKRDFEFAQFVNHSDHEEQIEITRVVVGLDGDDSKIKRIEQVQEDEGKMINSDFLNGLDIKEATEKISDYLVEKGWAQRVTSYRLRDWLISRQRYWGTPIPIVYDPEGNAHPVKEEHLPWLLPTDVDFKPTGESPLKSSKEFIQRTQDLYGSGWMPEFDTMDTFVDSSWYYLRYVDSRNTDVFAAKHQLEKWLPVDLYMIGPEHIVLHLLYSRFFTKFLHDEGYLSFTEPFKKMRHQGMILGPDNRKMSKSKGNVINPDEIIEKFGADTLRVYEMFMGPLEADKPWDVRAVIGVYKFLQRINNLVTETTLSQATSEAETRLVRKLHQTIQKVTDSIPKLKFNTSIALMMELVNEWQEIARSKKQTFSIANKLDFIKILAPFAPFLADELYAKVTQTDTINLEQKKYSGVHSETWPTFDLDKTIVDEVTIPVQINGKIRAQFVVSASKVGDEKDILDNAKKLTEIQKYIEGKQIKKQIYIQGKIVSFVV